MAQLHSGFPLTGSFGNLVAYKRRDSDKIIVRTKGGGSREKIRTAATCENIRRNNAEFGGRSTASKWIRRMIWPQNRLADPNFTGELNKLVKPLQEADTESIFGQRHVLLSRQPRLLEGFNLNQKHPFSSIVRNPLSSFVSREERRARISVPALVPGINFSVPSRDYPFYSIVAALGILPDLLYSPYGYRPASEAYRGLLPVVSETAWFITRKGSAVAELEMQLDFTPPDESFSLILSVGIRFATTGANGSMQQLPYTGAARIEAMA